MLFHELGLPVMPDTQRLDLGRLLTSPTVYEVCFVYNVYLVPIPNVIKRALQRAAYGWA